MPSSRATERGAWPNGDSAFRRWLPEILLAAAMIASGVMLLGFTAHITFTIDEWDLLLLRPGWGFDQFLDPFHEHIVIAPAFSYKVLQTVFGMESARPMQVAAIGMFLLASGLFYAYVKRRVGAWAALIMTIVILFLGGAFEDLVWAFQIGYLGSLAAGLGALIMLDRDDRRGDLIAAVLLVVSITFSSLGIPFIAAAVAEWLLNPRDRRGRTKVTNGSASIRIPRLSRLNSGRYILTVGGSSGSKTMIRVG